MVQVPGLQIQPPRRSAWTLAEVLSKQTVGSLRVAVSKQVASNASDPVDQARPSRSHSIDSRPPDWSHHIFMIFMTMRFDIDTSLTKICTKYLSLRCV